MLNKERMSNDEPEKEPMHTRFDDGPTLGGKVIYPDGIIGSDWIALRPGASTAWAYQMASAFVLYFQPNEGMFGTYYPKQGRACFLTDTGGWLEMQGGLPW